MKNIDPIKIYKWSLRHFTVWQIFKLCVAYFIMINVIGSDLYLNQMNKISNEMCKIAKDV